MNTGPRSACVLLTPTVAAIIYVLALIVVFSTRARFIDLFAPPFGGIGKFFVGRNIIVTLGVPAIFYGAVLNQAVSASNTPSKPNASKRTTAEHLGKRDRAPSRLGIAAGSIALQIRTVR